VLCLAGVACGALNPPASIPTCGFALQQPGKFPPLLPCSTGHKGKFGHEFMEFEFRPDGRLRYANNSNYKNDTMIRKEVRVSKAVLEEAKRIIEESEILE